MRRDVVVAFLDGKKNIFYAQVQGLSYQLLVPIAYPLLYAPLLNCSVLPPCFFSIYTENQVLLMASSISPATLVEGMKELPQLQLYGQQERITVCLEM